MAARGNVTGMHPCNPQGVAEKRTRSVGRIGCCLTLVLMAALLLPQAAVALESVEVERAAVASERQFDAVLEAVHHSTVSAQTGGQVIEILVDVDDFVPAGAVILRLRDREQRSAFEAAQAGLREAQVRHDEAQAEFARIRDIFERQLVPRAQFDRAEADLKAAAERLEAARARRNAAREQLDHTVVRAPFAGIVVERLVQVGETASPGQPLMRGLSLESLRAETGISQDIVNTVREQGQARVILPPGNGLPERSIAVERITVSPRADRRSHTFATRLYLEEGQQGLYPGMAVKVAFVTGEQQRLVIPRQALVHRGEVVAVYVVGADGALSLRKVRPGRAVADERIEIVAGLEAGEQVALDPVAAGIALVGQRQGGR